MSSIQKLLIQGIRSFGTGDDQKVVIQFGTPLTLISGQNGAGKTTVIECLKYITTGELPPNSRGGAFVHDPKLVGEREVRGVVKLKFKDVTNASVVCHRMLASIQKPRKIEQKTLDASLEKTTPTGEKRKITSRCGEIDREMVAHLGVSKAILNNVIFCHQEDSTWPLSEGKTLKSKFDDIFASTRYTKALDNIKKSRQEHMQQCKMYQTELHYLSKEKDKAEELQGNLRETQQKVDSSKADVTRIKSELEPIDDRLQELNDKYEQVTTMERNIAKLESGMNELVRSQRELEEKVETPFTGTRSHLQETIAKHQSHLDQSESELKGVKRNHSIVCDEENEVKGQLSQLYQEQGRLSTEETYHQQRIKNRDARITSMASGLTIEGYTEGPYSTTAVKSFISKVTKQRQQMEVKAKQEKEKYIENERKLQDQLNELRTNLAQLGESKRMKQKNIEENTMNVAEIRRELTVIGSGGAALEGVEQELQRADNELTEYRTHIDLTSLETSVQSLQEEKKKLDERVSTLQSELSRISQQSSARGALDSLRNQKRVQEETYQNEMGGLETDLLSFFGFMPGPEDDLNKKLTELGRTKEVELRRKAEQCQRDSSQLSRLETQKEEIMKQLSQKKSREEQLQSQVSLVTGETSLPFEEAMQQVKEQIDKKHDDISTVKGSESFFQKSLEKVHENKKCPLCLRGFDSPESFENTISQLTDRLTKSIPALIPRMLGDVQELQEKQEKLIELKPKMEELSILRSTTIPGLEKGLSEKTKAISKALSSASHAKTDQTKLQTELEQIRSLQPRVSKVSHLREALRVLDQKIISEESKIGGMGASTRSQLVVNRELQESQRSVEEMNRRLDHKRQEITESHQTLRQLEDRVHSLREEKLKLQSRLQKREQLIAKKNELTAQIKTLDREIKTLSHQLVPVQDRLSALESEKTALCVEREETEATNRAEINSLKGEETDVTDRTTTIRKYIERGADKALAECNKQLSELQALSDKKGDKKKELEERKQSIEKQLANAKVRERELSDNMKLLRQKDEIQQKEKEVKRLKVQLREMGLDKYEEEYQRCQRESDRLRKEKARCEGHSTGLEDQVKSLQKQLNSDMYRDTETRYRHKMIELKTTEAANRDQERYYKALDRAIMRFHSIKMEEINKILRELWIKTYRGGDIDAIEIRSEDTTDGANLGQRRVYNYRVVLVKGQTVLDMRGRCSAGQKVLASILIRLALAETFCLNCGLLALDEPTTNLDSFNAEGLAQSLAEIIRERSKHQKNFQLIIITHDESFRELLGHTGFTDCFFEVSKPVGECSRIGRKYFSGAAH